MTASQHQFNAALGPATVWTYGQPGKTPVLLGPTIVAQTGRPVVVEVDQQPSHRPGRLPAEGRDRPDDRLGAGVADSAPGRGDPAPPRRAHARRATTARRCSGGRPTAQKGEDYVTDTFTYLNDQPASLSWYHDHTMGATRFKPYLGLAAGYLIFDKVDNGTTINGQKVPSGYGKYHLPLVLQDKQFNDDGTLFYPTDRRRQQRHPPDLGARVLRRHAGGQRQGLSLPERPAEEIPAPSPERLAGPLLQPAAQGGRGSEAGRARHSPQPPLLGHRLRRRTASRAGEDVPAS